MKTYLFILSPPYQGSTVLYKLIASSPNVSTLISSKILLMLVKDVHFSYDKKFFLARIIEF